MPRVRVRQHVNPLSHKFRQPVTFPDWSLVYANLEQPLHLDIGSARGRFLLKMAAQFPERNFLGTEIREALVEEANALGDELGLKNLHFVFCNVNIWAATLLPSLPANCLNCVSIQFPDPWFKRDHFKRRVVQPELVQEIATFIRTQGLVFLQSDVESIAREMRQRFRENGAFQESSPDWLTESIFPVPTEREAATLQKQQPVYRAAFLKK